MNQQEAKQLLELCRPGSEEDRQDPALAEAFALLASDAELQAWFDEQQAIDAQISESINAIPVPADLKASILAGMHLHQAHATEGPDENEAPIPFAQDEAPRQQSSRAWWQSPWIGIAALFVVALIILKPGIQQPDAAENTQLAVAGLPPVIEFLSQEISALKSSQLQFDKKGPNPGELQAFLTSSQAPSPDSIPVCLEKMPSLGCITFEYEGAKLSMICFKESDVYHLITADKATYPGKLPTTPEVFECHKQVFKVWVEGEQVKILSTEGNKDKLPEFI